MNEIRIIYVCQCTLFARVPINVALFITSNMHATRMQLGLYFPNRDSWAHSEISKLSYL